MVKDKAYMNIIKLFNRLMYKIANLNYLYIITNQCYILFY